MTLELLLSACLLALAGVPHCTAMCAAPCAVATGGPRATRTPRLWAFHGARFLAYAAAGALAASSVGALAAAAQWHPLLRLVWTLLHAAALSLGLWLMVTGRQPAWLGQLGHVPLRPAGPVPTGAGAGTGELAGWQRVQGPGRAALAGGLWVAWPCGLLQSALVLAALANGAAGGALVMAGFAIVSATGLLLGPRLWAWLAGTPLRAGRTAEWGVRLAGLALTAAAAFALGHGVWAEVVAFCVG